MSDLVRSLSQDPEIALAATGTVVGCLTGIVIAVSAIVSSQWRRVRQSEEVNALKQYMLEQGMSAEEIAVVISASPKRRYHGVHFQCGDKRVDVRAPARAL